MLVYVNLKTREKAMLELQRSPNKSNKYKFTKMLKVSSLFFVGILTGVFLMHFYVDAKAVKKENDYKDIKKDNKINVCVTKECLKAAYEIASSIDTSKQPCDDFYEFSCGNFLKNSYENNIPSPLSSEQTRATNQLNAIIAEPIEERDWQPVLLEKKFYQACMNLDRLDQSDTMLYLIDELGGWPVVEGSNWSEKDWKKVMIKCKHLGVPFDWFLKMTVSQSELVVSHPDENISEQDEFKNAIYLNLMIQTAQGMGATKANAENEMTETIEFMKELDKIILNGYRRTDYSIEKIQREHPQIDWLHLINGIMKEIRIYESNDTVLYYYKYAENLIKLLENTPKRTQVNFIIWKIIYEFGNYLPSTVRKNFEQFTRLSQDKPSKNRAEFCILEAKKRFLNIAEMVYMKKYMGDSKATLLKQILANIKNQYEKDIEKYYWIDDVSKQQAIQKLKNTEDIIASHIYVADIYNLTETAYSDLNFTSDCVIDIIRKKHNWDFSFLSKLGDDSPMFRGVAMHIIETSTEINAYYLFNRIIITPAVSQGIFFNENRPNYLNYGAIGIGLGHEVAHGFDVDSETHDDKGIAVLLWQNETYDEMYNRSRCVTEEYDNFKIMDGFNGTRDETYTLISDGTNVFVENSADLIGIGKVHDAYQHWTKNNNDEATLPGLNYTQNQLFWLRYSTIMCYRHLSNWQDWKIGEDNMHGLNKFRTNFPLKNYKGFADDFNCPLGSPMNPEEKCIIF